MSVTSGMRFQARKVLDASLQIFPQGSPSHPGEILDNYDKSDLTSFCSALN